MKQCKDCKKNKPLSDFYVLSTMSDGYCSSCKECVKKSVKARADVLRENPEWVESEKIRAREKYHRLYIGKKVSYKVQQKRSSNYVNKYPEKRKATYAAYKIKCKKGEHRHHWSYNTEHYLDVIIISFKFHAKIHRYMKYIPNKMMYSTLSDTLLDTREKHLNYINQIKELP